MAVQSNITKAEKASSVTERTCVLILGMHRSGTSALAGVLSKLGCELPASPMPESHSNAKGFFESTKVRDFNEELLASAGSSWDDFTPFPDSWLKSPRAPAFLDRAVILLSEEFGASPLFVLKDPRICRLMPFWNEALHRFGASVKPILTIRNPLEVANSLQSKKNYGEPFSEMVWLRHVLDAERATRGERRFHTSFGQLMAGWESVAKEAQQQLGVTWPRPAANVEFDVQKFLSADLRHHKQAPARVVDSALLPDWLRATYEILERWVEQGESASDYLTLDRIKAEFDVASMAFARIVRAERETLNEHKQKIGESEAACVALEHRIQTMTASWEEQRRTIETSLAEQRAEADRQLAARAAEREVEEAERLAEREELRATIESLGAEARLQTQTLEALLEEQRIAFAAEREALQREFASAEQEISAMKASRQAERRQKTLLEAELQQAREAKETASGQLKDVRAELAASQTRRKEASRVIARRDAEIQKRFEELAALERHILRSSLSWRIRNLWRRGGKVFS